MIGPVAFVLFGLAVLLTGGLWIGISLFSVGVLSLEFFRPSMRVDRFLANDFWSSATAVELVTLPLFILMGEILFHTRLSSALFSGLAPWTNRLPGRLLHVNVIGCTLFAAVSGSSAATLATVGRITLKELLARGYNRSLAMGSLAGAGTLGFLIPPSIPMIVYGVLADVSILDMFAAGIGPGLALAAGYMIYLAIRTTITPSMVPAREESIPWGVRIRALGELWPIVFLIVAVIGSMYAGWASVTEAAAIGVLGALLIALMHRTLTLATLKASLFGAVRTCSMIALIILGALFLSKGMAALGVPRQVAGFIDSLGLSPYELILLLLVFYLALGCVLDGLSAIVMTLPVTLPLAIAAGFDPIWFGVFLVITIEMAQVTPPVGFNLFIIKGFTGDSLGRIAQASLPFLLIMVALVGVIAAFPELVTWLPRTIK